VLKDAVILITGGGKGIGEACVLELIEKRSEFPGLKLFLTSRTSSELEHLRDLAEQNSIPCAFLAVDLATGPLAAFDACLEFFGRVDALIHCAGVGRFGDFLSLSQEDLEFVMKTNVEASFLLLQAVYAQMKKLPVKPGDLRGQIQWVTSVAAEKPFEQSAIYCMSKYAQRGLIEVIRLYARQDQIRILEVKPGATFTPMWGEVDAEKRAKMMEPKDIAIPMIDALLLNPRASLEELTLRPILGDL
jgi:sepiapterin reductase